jgi:capsular exopolysaccharide synthesis family protein
VVSDNAASSFPPHGQPGPKDATGPEPEAPPVRGYWTEPPVPPSHAVPAPLPPALATGPNTAAILKGLRRRWLLALSLGSLLAAAVGGAAWYFLSAKYTAVSQVQVSSSQFPVVFVDTADGRTDFLTYLRTQAARIKSRYVLSGALKSDGVKGLDVVTRQADPINWLTDKIKVEYQDGNELITISMSGDDPDQPIALVNAVTQAYLKDIDLAEHEHRSKRFAEVTDLYDKAAEKLRIKKESYYKLAKDLQTSDPQALSQRQVNLLATLGERSKQYAQVQFDLKRAQSRLESHKAREKSLAEPPAISETEMTAFLEADPTGRRHVLAVASLQKEITELSLNYPDTEPVLINARRRVEALKKALETRRTELLPDLKKRRQQQARADFDNIRAQLEAEIGPLAQLEADLKAQVEDLSREAAKQGNHSTELETMGQEIKRDERALDRLWEEKDKLGIELRRPSRVTLYQEAALLDKDVKKQLIGTILGPVAVLALVCFAVGWWEFRARRICSAEEVALGLGMRVVGAVPALPRAARKPAGSEEDESVYGHGLLESIDGIRTVLLRDASVEATRVIMVTSGVAGEGKTTLASHLAGSLARAGRRTLLIDCDLRRPSVHQLFEVPLQPGFCEALLGEVFPAEATKSTTVDGLWVMPAGEWDREVVQALAMDGVEAIFAKLKAEYDFIVVDSHPVLPATDSLLVGQHVDAVILSILRDVSQAPRVYAARQRLEALGIRVLGAVINGTSPDEVYGHGASPAPQPARAG